MKFIATFQPGEDVPEWLLMQEPKSPTARPATLTFRHQVDLFERHGEYWIIPTDIDTYDDAAIEQRDGANSELWASAKRIVILGTVLTIDPVAVTS